jgi:hypothetical protein
VAFVFYVASDSLGERTYDHNQGLDVFNMAVRGDPQDWRHEFVIGSRFGETSDLFLRKFKTHQMHVGGLVISLRRKACINPNASLFGQQVTGMKIGAKGASNKPARGAAMTSGPQLTNSLLRRA